MIIGIDLGIRKAAYSAWSDDEVLVHAAAREVSPQKRSAELSLVSEWVEQSVYEIAMKYAEPVYVFIETPLIGNNRDYSLKIAQMYGAVLAELAWFEEHGRITVYGVNVSEWKKQTVGKGNATKDDVKNYISVLSGRYAALCEDDQDRFDAVCIGLYGCRVATRADSIATGS